MMSYKKFFSLFFSFILLGGVVCYLILRFSKPDLLFRANQKIEKGFFQEAIPLYLDLLKTDPENALSHYNLGNLYFETKDYPAAKGHFLLALDANEKDLRKKGLFNLGNTAFCLQDLDGALHAYERAFLLEKDYQAARLNHDFVKKIETLLNGQDLEGLEILLKDSCFQPPQKQQPQDTKNQNQDQDQTQEQMQKQEEGQKKDEGQEDAQKQDPSEQEKETQDGSHEHQGQEEGEDQQGAQGDQKPRETSQDKQSAEQWLKTLSDDPSRALEFLIRKKSVEKKGKFDKDW